MLSNDADRSEIPMFLTPTCALYKSAESSVVPSWRQDTADAEPASVTDEAPAGDSAGRGGPVE